MRSKVQRLIFSDDGEQLSSHNIFYFNSSVSPSGNRFSNMSLLLQAGDLIPGKKIIYYIGGAVASGTYDFANYEIYYSQSNNNNPTLMTFSPECTILNFPNRFDVYMSFENSVAPVCTNDQPLFEIVGRGGFRNTNTSFPVIQMDGEGVARIILRDEVTIDKLSTQPIINIINGAQLVLSAHDTSQVTGAYSDGASNITVEDYSLIPGGFAPNLGIGTITRNYYQSTRVNELTDGTTGTGSLNGATTFNGTAPSGTETTSYRWRKVGKLVFFTIIGDYTINGSGVTTVQIDLDSIYSALPNPTSSTPVSGGCSANSGTTFGSGIFLPNSALVQLEFTSTTGAQTFEFNCVYESL